MTKLSDPTAVMQAWLDDHRISLIILAEKGEQQDPGNRWRHFAYDLRLNRVLPDEPALTFDTQFRMGIGNTDGPSLPDVFDSLLSDAMSYQDSTDFLDFVNTFDMPMETHAERKQALALYDGCKRVHEGLVVFLGGEDVLDEAASLERL